MKTNIKQNKGLKYETYNMDGFAKEKDTGNRRDATQG